MPLLSNFWTPQLLLLSDTTFDTDHLEDLVAAYLSSCRSSPTRTTEYTSFLLNLKASGKLPKSAITRGDGALFEETFSTMMRREVFETIRNISQRRWRSPSPRRKCISHRCTRIWYIHEIRTVFVFKPGREHHAGITTAFIPGHNNRYRKDSDPSRSWGPRRVNNRGQVSLTCGSGWGYSNSERR